MQKSNIRQLYIAFFLVAVIFEVTLEYDWIYLKALFVAVTAAYLFYEIALYLKKWKKIFL